MQKAKQKLLLEYLISSPDLFAICDSVVQPSYFDADLRSTVKLLKSYYNEYKNIPAIEIISAETGLQLTEQEITRDKFDYCVSEIEAFCKRKAIVQAIQRSADLLEKEDYGQIEADLKEAISVSITKDLGLSLFEDPGDILRSIAQSEVPISTGFDELDKLLFGGLIRKQLFVISAPSGGGKSISMNNLALNYVEQGYTVLFISLELSQELNYLRLASMMSDVGQRGWQTNINEMAEKIRNYQTVYGGGNKGNLYVKRMASQTRPSQMRALIKEFELLKGVTPDVLVVDYLDIMGSDVKVPMDNISLRDKYITEGLREVLNDYNMIGITGSQVKKEAQEDIDVEMSQVAGGQTKMNTADVWASCILTPAMKDAGTVAFKMLKTRTSDGQGKLALLDFNNVSLRFTNSGKTITEQDVEEFKNMYQRLKKDSSSSRSQFQQSAPASPQQGKPSQSSTQQLLAKMAAVSQEFGD